MYFIYSVNLPPALILTLAMAVTPTLTLPLTEGSVQYGSGRWIVSVLWLVHFGAEPKQALALTPNTCPRSNQSLRQCLSRSQNQSLVSKTTHVPSSVSFMGLESTMLESTMLTPAWFDQYISFPSA